MVITTKLLDDKALMQNMNWTKNAKIETSFHNNYILINEIPITHVLTEASVNPALTPRINLYFFVACCPIYKKLSAVKI